MVTVEPGKGTWTSDETHRRAIALAADAEFVAVTPEGGERRLAVRDVPAGKRAARGSASSSGAAVAAVRAS